MKRESTRWRRLLFRAASMGLAGLVAAATLVAVSLSDDTAAEATSAWDFDAGYIISDANFYNSGSMTASEVQSFLNERVPMSS